MRKIGLIMVAVMTGASFFSSCYYDNVQELYGTTACDTTSVNYSTSVLPVIESNCYLCHSSANAAIAGGGIDLEGYSNIMNHITAGDASSSVLYNDIAWVAGANPMPKGMSQLTDCEIAAIRVWINNGAVNN